MRRRSTKRVGSHRAATKRSGKIKYGILAWMIGLPLPIVVLLLFYRGCDF
jgi:hypothetical protein